MYYPVYVGKRARMLCVLAFLKLTKREQSHCSFWQYARTLKKDRVYKLHDDGVIFITRIY
jgi:hypothetical protein